MKILIVDNNAETKCKALMEECKRRNIEIVVKKSIDSALKSIMYDEEGRLNGIIMDIGLPLYENGRVESPYTGERILQEISMWEKDIPVLIFSETCTKSHYISVFDRMKDWDIKAEQIKFFKFLEYLNEKQPLI